LTGDEDESVLEKGFKSGMTNIEIKPIYKPQMMAIFKEYIIGRDKIKRSESNINNNKL
jgi:hypothetical protein